MVNVYVERRTTLILLIDYKNNVLKRKYLNI